MKIGFFGAGNMASAMSSAFKKNDPSIEIYFYTPSKVRAQDISHQLNGHFVEYINSMPKDLDWYFLSFKPQSFNNFEFTFNNNSKIVSMLAATEIRTIKKKFNSSKIVRLMPNTPSKISYGMNLMYFEESFDKVEINEFEKLMSFCGESETLENEMLIDLLTPFSGSGPGLIFELAQIFESNLKEILGENSKINTKKIIAQTFLGSSQLMKIEKDKTFGELRDEVTSKKGVTYAALETMNEGNVLSKILGKTFNRAINRIDELKSEQLEKK